MCMISEICLYKVNPLNINNETHTRNEDQKDNPWLWLINLCTKGWQLWRMSLGIAQGSELNRAQNQLWQFEIIYSREFAQSLMLKDKIKHTS